MNPEWIANIVIGLVSGAFAAGGAWFAVRVEMRYMRRDIDDNRAAIKEVESRRHDGEGVLHDRVTRLNERMTAAGVNGPRVE